jgi:outer membrane protein OmpA-like peptidoglycan-associated protein/opacity protein-like surface antigen
MKKIIYPIVLVGLILMSQQNYAQFNDWGTKFGFRGSLLFPENEFANFGFNGNDNTSFDWFKGSWLAEGFFAFELTKALELSLNAGYGTYAGKAYFDDVNTTFGEYKSTIIPLSIRFRVTPFDSDVWNPYIYVGGGAMSFSVDTKPTNVPGNTSANEDGWVAVFPIGLGAEFALSDNVILDFGLGGAITSSYDLDGFRNENSDVKDAYYNASLGLTFTSENCESDKDADGLGKCEEEKIGTDPKNPDSDNDGLTDGEEYLTHTTNPLQADTDSDGLSDADEVKSTKTDPLIADTDKDGLNDGEELNQYKTNPLIADTDSDGLNDGYEVVTSKTDPLIVDTDKDGLNDGEETNNYKTNPLIVDTDTDSLSDYEEVLKYKTNPLNIDTDGGTIDDYTEVNRGTDPLNAEDDVVKIGVPIVLEGITFTTGKADITPESEKILMQALKTLQTYPDISVEISGHTDNVGSNSSNQKLSQRRADAVKGWLVSKGVPAERITAVGYGEESPRVANDTPENKRLNRRIEFKRIK